MSRHMSSCDNKNIVDDFVILWTHIYVDMENLTIDSAYDRWDDELWSEWGNPMAKQN